MRLSKSRLDLVKEMCGCKNSVAAEEVPRTQHLQQQREVLWRFRVALLLNNWISTEPRSMTLSTADLFCWIRSYSKRSPIILPGCQENLKAFKPLCSKRRLKSAKAAHRTKEPQNALELLGSIKLSILYRALMYLGCMPSRKRSLTWSRKGRWAASVPSLNLSWKKNEGFVSRRRITGPASTGDIPSWPICPLFRFLSFQHLHSLLFNESRKQQQMEEMGKKLFVFRLKHM